MRVEATPIHVRESWQAASAFGGFRAADLSRRRPELRKCPSFAGVTRRQVRSCHPPCFAPLYLSNEVVNNCKYCGFSRDNPIVRVTLSVEDVLREARALREQGFRNLLLVAGEHPKFVSGPYLADCIRALHAEVPGISLELGPMETEDYLPLVQAGADGLVVLSREL